MDGLKFTWNVSKANANSGKHGVSFEEATSVFSDDYARLISDPDHSVDEERFILLGVSARFRLLVVCHCYREEGRSVRIISAREATTHEHKQYEGFRNER
jgi:uncharacterized DUF497 family protein